LAGIYQKKLDFGQKGGNGIEPLKDWIKATQDTEKLALSENFYKTKSLGEKLERTLFFCTKKLIFDFVSKYREKCEQANYPQNPPSSV